MTPRSTQTVEEMREAVFYEGSTAGRGLSRFWILLVLASTIAAAGVVADSTPTVIGAMIVAPLMVPIQGTMLAVTFGDRSNLVRSLALVAGGALAAIAVGYVVGLVVVNDVVAATNPQVAGRVSPRLIDLLAALATGAVGSIAIVRKDIADTLPGVAVAAALVLPLTVAGLTIEAGALDQATGALLLFATNVAAIVGTGIVIMAIYRVQRSENPGGTAAARTVSRRNANIVIGAAVALVVVPLAASTVSIVDETTRQVSVRDAARRWADDVGWELIGVDRIDGRTVATFEGPLPLPELEPLRQLLIDNDVSPNEVRVELDPRQITDFTE